MRSAARRTACPIGPVANELVTQSGEKIQVRWYRTHGEQFHTKIALITHGDRLDRVARLGQPHAPQHRQLQPRSERRARDAQPTQRSAMEMISYFDRLWNNDGPPGTDFTAAFGALRDEDTGSYWRYA